MSSIRKITGNTLVRGTASYLIANIVNAAVPFLLLPVLTRYLDPAEYGEVAVFQVWVALLGALCGLSVHGAANRKYFDYDEPDKYIGIFITSCLVVLTVSTIAMFVVVAPLSSWLSQLLGITQMWLTIGVFVAFCNFLIQLRLGQWQVRTHPTKYGAFQITRSILDMALSLLFVAVMAMGAVGRLGGYTLATVVCGLLAVMLLYRDGLVRKAWKPELMREAVNFGFPLVPHILGMFLLLTIDRAIISAQLGKEAAGYYMVAFQLSMVMNLVIQSVNMAFGPWLFERLRRDDLGAKRFIVKLTYMYGLALLGCAALGFFVSGDLLVWIAGEKYAPAAEVIGWLVLAQAIRGMYFMVANYIFYTKKTGVIAQVTISVGVVNVILVVIMTHEFGIIGAAWALCISMTLQWLATWRAAAKLVPMPWTGYVRTGQ